MWRLGFRVSGLRFRVSGSRDQFRVQGFPNLGGTFWGGL